jgi:hypothetical protein
VPAEQAESDRDDASDQRSSASAGAGPPPPSVLQTATNR